MGMYKRKVIIKSVFIFVLVGALLILQIGFFKPNTTGFAVSSDSSEFSEIKDFSVNIERYDLRGSQLSAQYYVTKDSSDTEILDVSYVLYENGNRIIHEGMTSVVMKGNEGTYLLQLPLSSLSEKSYLALEIRNKEREVRDIAEIAFSTNPITGSVVGTGQTRVTFFFGIFFILLVLLFYGIKAIQKRHGVRKRFAQGYYKDRFISLK